MRMVPARGTRAWATEGACGREAQTSIADQVRHCRQEAARHPDWLILDAHVYRDETVSAVSVEGRLGLTRLVQAALETPRPFDLVIVDGTSRLSRDVVDAVQQFRELGLTAGAVKA